MSSEKKIMVGGQAVMEGVLMRSPENYAVAVRRPNGDIVVKKEPFITVIKRFKILGLPLLRGGVILIEALILGVKALSFSGDVAMEEENKKNGKEASNKSMWEKIWMALTVLFSFAIGLGLFFYVPLLLTGLFHFESSVAFNLVDGAFRLIFFLTSI